MQEKGKDGMSKINFIIIIVLSLVILLRSIFYLIVDPSTIYLIFTIEGGAPISYPFIWIFFRGIVAPIAYMTELTLISYMIYT
jgi:hypothetical protein